MDQLVTLQCFLQPGTASQLDGVRLCKKNKTSGAVLANRVYKVEDGRMFVQIYPNKRKGDLATLVSTLL